MILYRNTKVKVCSPDGDTEYFDIVAGVLQGDTLAPYLFIICLDYVLWTSIDKIRKKKQKKKIRENGFELTKRRSKRYPQKQSQTPTTLMTWRYWRIRQIKQRHYCIVWNEPQLALASMSMHSKLNICVTTKRATLPHKTEPL